MLFRFGIIFIDLVTFYNNGYCSTNQDIKIHLMSKMSFVQLINCQKVYEIEQCMWVLQINKYCIMSIARDIYCILIIKTDELMTLLVVHPR